MIFSPMSTKPSTPIIPLTPNSAAQPLTNNPLLAAILGLTARFDKLESEMESQFDKTDTRIEQFGSSISDTTAILAAIEGLNSRFDQLESRMNSRFDAINTHVQEAASLLDNAFQVPSHGKSSYVKCHRLGNIYLALKLDS